MASNAASSSASANAQPSGSATTKHSNNSTGCPAFSSNVVETGIHGPKGIPKAKFIENVEAFLKDTGFVPTQKALHELHSKYQYMEASLNSHRKALMRKVTDIGDAIRTVEFLQKRKEVARPQEESSTAFKARFALADNLYATAKVPVTNTVYLWLGANTLLEYPIEEAAELLKKNKTNADSSMVDLEESLMFLRQQLTTTEVNIARVHNYAVALRRKASSGASV